jgi:CRISPR-associated protein Csx3
MSQTVKVFVCGPPQSGKSCLREGLKKAIRCLPGAPYPYIITVNPDGEGSWFAETAQRNLTAATEYKKAYKTAFTPEFAVSRAEWVKNCREPLTIYDLGGKISSSNRLIMQYGTHAVILAGDRSKIREWQDFCADLKLEIIAIIYSDLDEVCDHIDAEFPLLTGTIHRLQRGEDVSSRPMIQALARVLVGLLSGV